MDYTINVQAICDSNGWFRDIDIKWPGSLYNACLFGKSEVQEGYTKEKFKLPYEELLPGDGLTPQILRGHSTYPLLLYLMKENAICQHHSEVMINTMLRSARNQKEYAFRLLKALFRESC